MFYEYFKALGYPENDLTGFGLELRGFVGNMISTKGCFKTILKIGKDEL